MVDVVVTGGTGHLGANLVRQLCADGKSVRLVVFDDNNESIDGLDVERVRGDVTDRQSLDAAFKGADVVIHMAAVISIVGGKHGLVRKVNVEGAGNAADACLAQGVRRMMHVASVHAFQMAPIDVPLDETRARVPSTEGRFNAYDRSKADGEREVRKRIEQGLDAVILHPTGVMGPFDYMPSRMGQVFLDLVEQKVPSLVEGSFNWVDVRDVCTSIRAAVEQGRTAQSYLLGGHHHSVKALADIAEGITGVKAPSWVCPMWLAQLGAPSMELFSRLFQSEPLYTREALEALRGNLDMRSDLAAKELGHTPRSTEETVRDCYRWFAQQGRLPDGIVVEGDVSAS